MKKVFASVPLKGRSKDQIQESLDKIKAAVEGLLDEKVEILHQDVKNLPEFDKEGVGETLEFIGKDLELMAKADYFATIDCNYSYAHCFVEEEIFANYKTKPDDGNMFRFSLNVIAPDVIREERKRAEKLWKMEFDDEPNRKD